MSRIVNSYQDAATGRSEAQKGTNGSAHFYALARKPVKQAAGTYSATEILGYRVLTAPTADNSALTGVDGVAQTALPAAGFAAGSTYSEHLSSITVGTGGVFLLYLPS